MFAVSSYFAMDDEYIQAEDISDILDIYWLITAMFGEYRNSSLNAGI